MIVISVMKELTPAENPDLITFKINKNSIFQIVHITLQKQLLNNVFHDT